MIISLDSKTMPFDESMRDVILRHVQFALSRFKPEVVRVRVDGKGINGIRCETDQLCRITARLSGGTTIAVSEEAPDLLTAGARAADRLGRAVARAIDRARTANSDGESSVHRRSRRLKS